MSFDPVETSVIMLRVPTGGYPQNAVESNTVEISDFRLKACPKLLTGRLN